jgi:hypothetical protein
VRHNSTMQSLFPDVMFAAVGLFVLAGVLSMFTRRNLHDQIGQGGLLTGEGLTGPSEESSSMAPIDRSSVDRAERELEIRQMLTARSDRLVRQGRAPLDIDAELARIDSAGQTSSHDAALAEEVRQLVRARNERRARHGLEALDVEAEVQRTLSELSP